MGRGPHELIKYEPARENLLSLQLASQPTTQPKHCLSWNNRQDPHFDKMREQEGAVNNNSSV